MSYLLLIVDLIIFLLILYYFHIREGEHEMSIIYCTLIVNGKKKFSQVPETIKEQVRQILIDLDLEFLTQE